MNNRKLVFLFRAVSDVTKPKKMAALQSFQFSTIQISVTFLFFDQVCVRLHGLIRTCIFNSLAFNVAVSFKML